ncbi:MAG: cephalosporin hydroxylase related enzyme [Schlesneria sp.]|nr:cephalosporin hydroxylase related enzyme [Schlesneria sp.]
MPDRLVPKIIDSINIAGSDNVASFGGLYEGGYHIQHSPQEFAQLVCLLAALGPFSAYLEIGTAAGGTIRFLNDHIQIDRNVVIDDGTHPKAHFWASQNRHCVPNVVDFIGDSHSPEAAHFLSELGLEFDLVSIDADHSYSGAAADWNLIQDYTRPGAIVWFHDILACDGVAALWNELKVQQTVLLETDQFGIGVLKLQ